MDYAGCAVFFFSLRPSRLPALSCFVNTLKVSVGINWPRIRADVNEPSLSLSRRRTVITVEIRDTYELSRPGPFFAYNFCKLPFREISSVMG